MTEPQATLSCPHGETCGACAHLGTAYEDQLALKRDHLRGHLARYPALRGATVPPCVPSPLTATYRNRVKMAVGLPRRGGAIVGYFRARTREIVDAPDCAVLLPELLETTRALREMLAASPDVPRELRHLDLRCGSDPESQHLTLVFRAERSPHVPVDALREVCGRLRGIAVNLNPGGGSQVIRGAIRPVWGEREVWVEHAGLRLRVSPGSFFQVNLALLDPLHERMRSFLPRGGVLADLYAGVGTHGLALRRQFRRILFVEGTRSAVADLKATIRAHELSDLEVAAAPVERSVGRLKARRPDAVILNPSRAGARESVLEAVARSTADRVVYLSCEPETLCRDLDHLRRLGLETVSVEPVDMMPQTRQVEALALLRRRRQEAPRSSRAPGTPARERRRGPGSR